jgi:Flp pilus assembly protein TadG
MQLNITKTTPKLSDGQSLVEMAIMLPLLILILFGVLDLGRGLHALVTIHNAARVGARYGIQHPNDYDGMKAAAVLEATNSGIAITLDDVAVACPDLVLPAGCDRGAPIRVTISHDFVLVMGFILPSPIEISRYVEMMVP